MRFVDVLLYVMRGTVSCSCMVLISQPINREEVNFGHPGGCSIEKECF